MTSDVNQLLNIEAPAMVQAAARAADIPKEGHKSPTVGAVAVLLLRLFLASVGGFFRGFLLAAVLNLIPVLPARKRTTFNIMTRTYAIVLFGPLSLLGLALFPLWFGLVYRRAAATFAEWGLNSKTDLPGF